jgi:hypothetical protein
MFWDTLDMQMWANSRLPPPQRLTPPVAVEPVVEKQVRVPAKVARLPRKIFRRAQKTFRAKLHKAKWERELEERRLWKEHCESLTCPHCGNRAERGCCMAATLRFDEDAVIELRRMAGISTARHPEQKNELIGWLQGKSGPRGCGVMSWDNAVRALDEDR